MEKIIVTLWITFGLYMMPEDVLMQRHNAREDINVLEGETEEYEEMQAWRKRAKEIAKLVINGKEA